MKKSITESMIYGYMLNEAKYKPIIKNGISYPIIRKDGKDYTYKTPSKEILDKVSKGIEIVKKAFNEATKSEEFKKCAKAMKDNKIFNLTAASLYKDIDKEIYDANINNKVVIDVMIYNKDITQDIGYYEYEKGKLFLHIIDNAFKSVKKELDSLGIDSFIGDDFYGYTLWITLYKSKEEAEANLVEIKN